MGHSLILPAPEHCSVQLNADKMTGLSGHDRSTICVPTNGKPQNTATSPCVRPSLTWESTKQQGSQGTTVLASPKSEAKCEKFERYLKQSLQSGLFIWLVLKNPSLCWNSSKPFTKIYRIFNVTYIGKAAETSLGRKTNRKLICSSLWVW